MTDYTHDLNIANADGATVRADINDLAAALATNFKSASAPSAPLPGQRWNDTTANLRKRRNLGNGAWLVEGSLDETFMVARSSNTILGASDYGKTINATSTFTQTLDAAATLGDGWHIYYRNNGTGVITLDPNAAETINGSATIDLYPGEGCRISCNGTLFTTQGNPSTINLSGGQIRFPATQNASSNANTLDDYEEGTFTPTITFTVPGDLNVIYSTQVGDYTKCGNVINVSGVVVTSTFTYTTASSNTLVSGMPFPAKTLSGMQYLGDLSWAGITKANYTDYKVRLDSATSALIVVASGSGQPIAVITAAECPSTTQQTRTFNITYKTA